MKRILLSVLMSAGCLLSIAQQPDSPHVHWSYSGKAINDSVISIVFTAQIDSGWRLFSSDMPEDMPRTSIMLDSASATVAFLKLMRESGKKITAKEPLLDATVHYFENQAIFEAELRLHGQASDLDGNISSMTYSGDQFAGPNLAPFHLHIEPGGLVKVGKGGLQESSEAAMKLKRTAIDLAHPINSCGGTGAEGNNSSLLTIFVLGFVGGLLGLLMPCTFPMIPLTVSFFTKQSTVRRKAMTNASLYGFFIFLIYILLSIPFYFLDAGSSAILNNISTNAWLNISFSIVFFVFALSFFGLFEITLPGTISNKVGAKSGASSLGGIFFMALTLAIVSFSCTGPILGSLLVGALNQNGGAVQLTVAMAGFGLALGLPFALFAMFPRWLHSLPRSGNWMNTLKIVFAFIELALMIKFLSNADLVMHWGLLKREVFFAIWIGISIATSLYLFGIIRVGHDPVPGKLSLGRKLAATVFLLFALYLLPGLSNTPYANRPLISGFPPPLSYSIYGHESAKGKGVEANVVNDYEKALELARKENKPILIDFTGWACVNCRKMEENVWTDDAVSNLIRNHFVLVSLYVDDRAVLDKKEQFQFTASDGSMKKIETVGDKYATLQSENFSNASQPLYAIIGPDEKLMNRPVGYTPGVRDYAAWLQCGLDAFRASAQVASAKSH